MGTAQTGRTTPSPNNVGVIAVLNRINDQLARNTKLLANILEQLQRETAVLEPNYRRDLAEFGAFDWNSIGAIIVARDEYGPTKVEWAGHHWLRRNSSPNDKFGSAIWFSRPVSSSAEGTVYYTLIKFAPYQAEQMAPGLVPAKVSEQPVVAPSAPRPAVQSKDWRAEAEACTDPLMFDSTFQLFRSDYFTDSSRVRSAREYICGPWQNENYHAARCAHALTVYADYIKGEEEKQKTMPGHKIDGQVGIAKAKRAYQEWKHATTS